MPRPSSPGPSLPAWGVRVEILACFADAEIDLSLPAWGVRVEIARTWSWFSSFPSLPAWGVRVEMFRIKVDAGASKVTPRMGSAG